MKQVRDCITGVSGRWWLEKYSDRDFTQRAWLHLSRQDPAAVQRPAVLCCFSRSAARAIGMPVTLRDYNGITLFLVHTGVGGAVLPTALAGLCCAQLLTWVLLYFGFWACTAGFLSHSASSSVFLLLLVLAAAAVGSCRACTHDY